MQGVPIPLRNVQELLRPLLSEYHPSEMLVSERIFEVLEDCDIDAYAVDVEGGGECDFSELTGGPDLGVCCSLHVDHD